MKTKTLFLLSPILASAQQAQFIPTALAPPYNETEIASVSPLNADPYPFTKPTRFVFAGDSMSTGYALSNTNINWPAYLMNSFAVLNVVGTNSCVPGYTIEQMTSDYSARIHLLAPNSETNALLFAWCGVNNWRQSADSIYSGLMNYWALARNDGFRVVACTICLANSIGDANNAKMEQVNAMIRANGGWDYLLDGRHIVTTTGGTTTDGVHFNTNWHGIVARAAFRMLLNETNGQIESMPQILAPASKQEQPLNWPSFPGGMEIVTVKFRLSDSMLTGIEMIAETSDNANYHNHAWFIYTDSSDGRLHAAIHGLNGGNHYRAQSIPFSTDGPHDYAIVLDDSSPNGEVKFWLDGAQSSSSVDWDTKGSSGIFGAYQGFTLSRGGTQYFSDATLQNFNVFSGNVAP